METLRGAKETLSLPIFCNDSNQLSRAGSFDRQAFAGCPEHLLNGSSMPLEKERAVWQSTLDPVSSPDQATLAGRERPEVIQIRAFFRQRLNG